MSTEATPSAAAAGATSPTSNLPRPPRGATPGSTRFTRGSRRGGIGASRGGTASKPSATPQNSSPSDWTAQEDASEASEEVTQLKSKYSSQLKTLKDIFRDWTTEDLVFALQEVDGDVEMASDRIAGGHATQWGHVKKRSSKEKPKRTESPVVGVRGKGRGGSERGAERGSRGRGESRGSRGRGRGESWSRGRGGAPPASDATSTAATIASDETPTAWPDVTSADSTATIAAPESRDTNGINGTKAHEEPPAVATSAWVPHAKTVEEGQPQTASVNGRAVQKIPASSTPTVRQSRIVDPSSKVSWASILKPAPPAPGPKLASAPKSNPQQLPERPAPQAALDHSRGQDLVEEPAQTIHDPFTTAEPSRPKVQLPQPALPYIPSVITAPQSKEPQLPLSEPLTSRNLDLLEDQQSPEPQPPPTPNVSVPRASPAPKSDAPPGLGPRFSVASRESSDIMPGLPSQPMSGVQAQFGSLDLGREADNKPEEAKDTLHPPQGLEPQPTPNQQRASPAVQQPQPVPAQVPSQRIPSAQGQSQGPPAYQPATFGGLIPGQAQRYTGPAPGLTQSKEFGGFPYEQQYQGQGSGYGDYVYGTGGQGQYELGPRDYYYYQQQQRAPPSDTQRPATQSTTPSNADTSTQSQFSSTTPASTSTQPTPAPSQHSQPHHPQYPGIHPYWTNPYYASMYQQHYGGYAYYNQHKGMYQGQGYGSQYGGQQGGYDRFSQRDQSGYDSFNRMNYGSNQPNQPQQQATQAQVMQQHGSQQGGTTEDQSNESQQPTQQTSQQGQTPGYYSGQSRIPYGLSQSGTQPQQGGYQHHYPPQQPHAYGGHSPSYNSQASAPSQQSQTQGQGPQAGAQQNPRGQQPGGTSGGWGQQYGTH